MKGEKINSYIYLYSSDSLYISCAILQRILFGVFKTRNFNILQQRGGKFFISLNELTVIAFWSGKDCDIIPY